MLRVLKQIPTANKKLLLRSCWRSVTSPVAQETSLSKSLDAAYGWLCRAQDATPDDGVAAWYDLLQGWSASYPETTGYIIPTFLTYGSVLNDRAATDRAIRMADWEIAVQLPTGAVRSGVLTAPVGPAVFNTGQVLFGWAAAYQATREARYAAAAQRAAEWLLLMQDPDGAWCKELSLMTRSGVQTYNVRSAWGLAIAGQAFDEPRWTQAALKNAHWTLQQQRDNGWFDHNGFTDDEMPLLHTIAYTLEGVLGLGLLLQNEQCIEAARTGIRPLLEQYRKSGRLAGRHTPEWRPAVSWRCLTGEAQTALVLRRLARLDSSNSLGETATAILQDLARIQDADPLHRETCGGLAGSEPVWGGYCSFRYLNWAVKFYMDALLLELFDADVQGAAVAVQISESQIKAQQEKGSSHGD